MTTIKDILDEADRAENPVGAVRTCCAVPRMEGNVSIAGLPGTWNVLRSWEEGGVWLHEIVRIL